ncbi:Cytochrome b-c1 complex subunit 9, partial [Periplaneta americana]
IGKMALAGTVYNALFKRTSTFAATIMFGAFFFERTFDVTSEYIFESINKGKLWKHIKHNYE